MKEIEYFLLRIPSLLDDEDKDKEDGKILYFPLDDEDKDKDDKELYFPLDEELDLPLNKSAMLAASDIILYNYNLF